jgi:hypothetical protein
MSRFARSLGRSWFALTRDEQNALLLVLGLILLGIAVRAWHMQRAPTSAPQASAGRPEAWRDIRTGTTRPPK